MNIISRLSTVLWSHCLGLSKSNCHQLGLSFNGQGAKPGRDYSPWSTSWHASIQRQCIYWWSWGSGQVLAGGHGVRKVTLKAAEKGGVGKR